MNKIKNALKLIAINTLVFLVLFELIAIILIRGFHYTATPSFHTNKFPMSADVNPHFGVWHIPNTSFYLNYPCFKVMNYFNDYGARDKNRQKSCPTCKDRVIVLGDSFVEGFGVDTSQRLTEILERETGKPFLNFGTSGHFGSTQMRLLYENMASTFEHNTVLVGLFPANDFDEDNYELRSEETYKDRYRPYLVGDSSDYRLVYEVKDLEASAWHPDKVIVEKDRLNFLKNYTHTGRILALIKTSLAMRFNPDQYPPPAPLKPRINDFTLGEMDLLKYNLLKIKEHLPKGRVVVFTIQSLGEVNDFKETNKNKLGEALTQFCNDNEIIYVNLLAPFASHDNYSSLFIECDGHWSAEGHRLAAMELLPYFD